MTLILPVGGCHAGGKPQALANAGLEAESPVVHIMNGKQMPRNVLSRPKNDGHNPSFNPITPHRAVYDMTLASAKNSSNINGVAGRMVFEWADGCDGWAVQQMLQLRFTYAEGDESDVNSTVVSWEAKDGSRYNFNVRRLLNGQENEVFRGRASIGEEGGTSRYVLPKEKADITLRADTLFPSAHTKLILEKAAQKENFFTHSVFDGSDDDGLALVSAFIGEGNAKLKLDALNEGVRSNPLLDSMAWPIRLAFFKPESETGESDYEMDLVLQANGIARSMLIDYGDFAVSGTLSTIVALPPEASCKE